MVRGVAILLLLQFAGEFISSRLDLPIPGNVIGMVLLLGGLYLGWVRLEWVQEAADLLLSHLALFFVPAGVGVMVYFGLIAREWLPIVVATVVSTFVVMAVTGWVADRLAKKAGIDAG
jgi:holin-like protein